MLIAKERIRHNGVAYGPNDEIKDITTKDAERLVKLGVAFSMLFAENNDDKNIKKQLDNTFTAVELKDAAKEVGLEFHDNITKPNLIQLIIDSDKVEEVLSVEFEEVEE